MLNSTATQLLISANSLEEAMLLHDLGVPWVDIKEPRNGPLGRPSLELVEQAALWLGERRSGSEQAWSIAGGELVDWNLDEDQRFLDRLAPRNGCVKWGLAHCAGSDQWMRKVRELLNQIEQNSGDRTQGILVHYADHPRVDAPIWDEVLDAAVAIRIDKILIDTAVKDGSSLTDIIDKERLEKMLKSAGEKSVAVAIAGSIPLSHIRELSLLGPRWIGLRGAVCTDTTDRSSSISPALVQQALSASNLQTRPLSDIFSLDFADIGDHTASPCESCHEPQPLRGESRKGP